ncbi:hypothetical protein CYLTODRAFT_387329 [Cylindrobasidium torrendii FP15055 ss-10]|uniref:Metaxin glutathione S-transferase domain-containing protein n=1 Tax=Cylindrobasidium torrendii FP15055 ss-10 TaxID=1314674 RepID=A0A0D7BS96_9AGAR|nr:hypothetical protein CYLTODRAFT_387329 [Cylindrobasidium torrendii FP15055 ss-10]
MSQNVPLFARKLLAPFPLYTYPPNTPKRYASCHATLWIYPPLSKDGVLSADVECLKWQAYLALRGVKGLRIRTDVDPQGCLDVRLPSLQAPLDPSTPGTAGDDNLDLHAAHHIPAWADAVLNQSEDALEGYKTESDRDESQAWIALLEGNIHAALMLAQPTSSLLYRIFMFDTTVSRPIESYMAPPLPPRAGLLSLLPPQALAFLGPRIPKDAIESRYRDAIAALSDRLGTDQWFLGSKNPTPLDALLFAYLYCILSLRSDSSIRAEVTRRVNLVAWENRIRSQVIQAFSRSGHDHEKNM